MAPAKATRSWDGKGVHVAVVPQIHDRRHIEVGLTDEAARHVVLCLMRLKQTPMSILPGAEELIDALNYVLVGDPASVAAHRVVEAGKGMTPDGGYKAPEVPTPPWVEIRRRGQDGEV